MVVVGPRAWGTFILTFFIRPTAPCGSTAEFKMERPGSALWQRARAAASERCGARVEVVPARARGCPPCEQAANRATNKTTGIRFMHFETIVSRLRSTRATTGDLA
jgi:hypothetical protein